MIKQNMTLFIQTQKQKQLLMKGKLMMMYLNQSILQLYQIYKNFQEKVQAGLLIPSQKIILIFQNVIFSCQHLYQITKKISHPTKGFVNTQNINDNECFKWCAIRYLHPG